MASLVYVKSLEQRYAYYPALISGLEMGSGMRGQRTV